MSTTPLNGSVEWLTGPFASVAHKACPFLAAFFIVNGLCVSSTTDTVILFLAFVRVSHTMLIVAPSVASAHMLGILAKDPDTELMVNSVGSDNYKAMPRVTNEQIPQRTKSMVENEEDYPTSTVLPDIEAEAIIMHFPESQAHTGSFPRATTCLCSYFCTFSRPSVIKRWSSTRRGMR